MKLPFINKGIFETHKSPVGKKEILMCVYIYIYISLMLVLLFIIHWIFQIFFIQLKFGQGLCPMKIFIGHGKIWTRVQDLMCPVKTFTGHKSDP